MTDTDYDWRHGWIPLTMRAALQKTRGDREEAARLLGEARSARRARRAEFVSPHPRHRAEHEERKRWAAYSDDDLADELGAADDDDDLDRIVSELERRDRAQAQAERARARRRERRDAEEERRDAEEERRDAEYDAAMNAGDDPEAAYARIWGVTEEKVRRDAAAESLRSSGYRGKSFAELVAHAHRDHVDQAHDDAEEVCRGVLLTKEGLRLEAAGKLTPRALFSGPESRARRYASEELLRYWQENGRLTREDFAASLLGGHVRSQSTAAWS